MPSDSSPGVSVVIPCRNERAYIGICTRAMLSQEAPEAGFEVIAVDGMSDDGTREVLDQLANDCPGLRVLDNPARIVSSGLNKAIASARGSIIIRADAHTTYAHDYVRQCVEVLRATGADNVGGPWIAAGRGYVGRAIAAGFHSRFGSGGARAHDRDYEGPVDTVYLGCWRREVFDRIGGFDEELVRNQDDEFNLRLKRAGGTVWQSPRIRSSYRPRASLRQLWQQYVQYGYWKVRVIQKHHVPASWRHLAPPLFVMTMIALIGASPVSSLAGSGFVVIGGLYLVCTLAASLMTALRTEAKLLPVLPAVFACFHIGYGYGFVRGIWDFVILRRAPAAALSTITRETPQSSGTP
jgi:succinoglycan biosynthesis protein ExoA